MTNNNSDNNIIKLYSNQEQLDTLLCLLYDIINKIIDKKEEYKDIQELNKFMYYAIVEDVKGILKTSKSCEKIKRPVVRSYYLYKFINNYIFGTESIEYHLENCEAFFSIYNKFNFYEYFLCEILLSLQNAIIKNKFNLDENQLTNIYCIWKLSTTAYENAAVLLDQEVETATYAKKGIMYCSPHKIDINLQIENLIQVIKTMEMPKEMFEYLTKGNGTDFFEKTLKNRPE